MGDRTNKKDKIEVICVGWTELPGRENSTQKWLGIMDNRGLARVRLLIGFNWLWDNLKTCPMMCMDFLLLSLKTQKYFPDRDIALVYLKCLYVRQFTFIPSLNLFSQGDRKQSVMERVRIEWNHRGFKFWFYLTSKASLLSSKWGDSELLRSTIMYIKHLTNSGIWYIGSHHYCCFHNHNADLARTTEMKQPS